MAKPIACATGVRGKLRIAVELHNCDVTVPNVHFVESVRNRAITSWGNLWIGQLFAKLPGPDWYGKVDLFRLRQGCLAISGWSNIEMDPYNTDRHPRCRIHEFVARKYSDPWIDPEPLHD